MIKGVLFDLDNTLADFWRMKQDAVKSAVLAMIDAGLFASPEEATKEIMDIYWSKGFETQDVFDIYLNAHYGRLDYKILCAGVVAYRKSKDASLALYPNVVPVLLELIRRGKQIAVITDAPPKQAWLRLCYLNIHHFFSAVITPDKSGAHKPSPLPFRLGLEMLGINADEALMIGDWPDRDIKGASEVGIKTVFARYGDAFQIEYSGANYDIDDIIELLAIVDELDRG